MTKHPQITESRSGSATTGGPQTDACCRIGADRHVDAVLHRADGGVHSPSGSLAAAALPGGGSDAPFPIV